MITFTQVADQAYVCASLIRRIDEHTATPMPIDAQPCALITPTLSTHSIITLDNGMEFCSDRTCREIVSAMAESTQLPHDVAERYVSLSKGINVKAAYVVAILPYDVQLCHYLSEHSVYIHTACTTPRSLVVSADGKCCIASRYTPNTLLSKLGA
jgi:hypothetical protein